MRCRTLTKTAGCINMASFSRTKSIHTPTTKRLPKTFFHLSKKKPKIEGIGGVRRIKKNTKLPKNQPNYRTILKTRRIIFCRIYEKFAIWVKTLRIFKRVCSKCGADFETSHSENETPHILCKKCYQES